MTNTQPALTLVLTLLLTSCASTLPTQPSNVARVFSAPTPARSNAQTPAAITDALVPDFNQTLAGSQNAASQARLNISINEVDAREFFMGLVVDSDENMLVHPEVTGAISLELKNVTIAQVLDAVQKVYGYDYKKNDMGYIIYPATLQTKTFKIDHLDLLRMGNSNTSVSSGKQAGHNSSQGSSNQQGSGNQQGGNQSGNPLAMGPSGNANSLNASSSSSSSVRTVTNTDFWQELKDSLNHIIAVDPQATVDINQQSGVVIARAKPMQLREIENFLSVTQTQISRQVTLEAKILEVTLDDNHQDGVNWDVIVKEGINTTSLFTGMGAITGASTLTSIFTLGNNAGDFRAFVQLMDTQGKTNVLSSPRISTLNNQTAIIKVGQDEYFAYDIQSSNTSGSTSTVGNATVVTTPFPRLDVFFSGIALAVTPQIDDNEDITLHIHPSITEVTEVSKTFGNSIGPLPMALTAVRESDSIVKAKNGQIIVLGGLMQEKQIEKRQGLTGLARIPYIGNLFRINTGETHKSELIILLKASFIGSDADWQNDISSSKQRLEKLDASRQMR